MRPSRPEQKFWKRACGSMGDCSGGRSGVEKAPNSQCIDIMHDEKSQSDQVYASGDGAWLDAGGRRNAYFHLQSH